MIDHWYQHLGLLFFLAICGWALLRGEGPERIGAAAMLIATIATPLVQDRVHRSGTQWSVFAVDVVLLAVLILLALRSERTWTMFAAAFHLVGTACHLATTLDVRILQDVYITGQILWSYLVILSLAAGVWSVERRRGRLRTPNPV